MTQINSNLTGTLQASIGIPVGGGGIEVPDALLPVISIPAPLGSFQPNPATDQFLSNQPLSAFFTFVLNQGASTGPLTSPTVWLDRGIYRFAGQLMSTVFVGPAPSSASIKCARIGLFNPDGTTAVDIVSTPLVLSTPQIVRYDVTVHLSRQFYSLNLQTMVSTGVGQTIGAECILQIDRLV